MKAYITKYALTQGIFEVEGESYLSNGGMNCFKVQKNNQITLYLLRDVTLKFLLLSLKKKIFKQRSCQISMI